MLLELLVHDLFLASNKIHVEIESTVLSQHPSACTGDATWKSNYVIFWLKSYRAFQWHLNTNLMLPRRPVWIDSCVYFNLISCHSFFCPCSLYICSSSSTAVFSCLWHLLTFLYLTWAVCLLIPCKLTPFHPWNLSLNTTFFERLSLSFLSKGHFSVSVHTFCFLILHVQICLCVFVCLFIYGLTPLLYWRVFEGRDYFCFIYNNKRALCIRLWIFKWRLIILEIKRSNQ